MALGRRGGGVTWEGASRQGGSHDAALLESSPDPPRLRGGVSRAGGHGHGQPGGRRDGFPRTAGLLDGRRAPRIWLATFLGASRAHGGPLGIERDHGSPARGTTNPSCARAAPLYDTSCSEARSPQATYLSLTLALSSCRALGLGAHRSFLAVHRRWRSCRSGQATSVGVCAGGRRRWEGDDARSIRFEEARSSVRCVCLCLSWCVD